VDVVDVAGHRDPRRDARIRQNAVDTGADRLSWVQHRDIGQRLLVLAGALDESAAELLVGEQRAAAAGVVDDGGLEVRAVGRLGLDQVADNARPWITAGVARPSTVRATIASPNSSPRKSAGSVL
jgi:hypothetical protein